LVIIGRRISCRRGPVAAAAAAALDRVADRRHGLRIRSENDTTTYQLGPLSYGPAGINKTHSLSYVYICVYYISPLTTTTTATIPPPPPPPPPPPNRRI